MKRDTEMGWIYQMSRVIDGHVYQHNLAISKYEMHYRKGVAVKVRWAREQLRHYIKKSLFEKALGRG